MKSIVTKSRLDALLNKNEKCRIDTIGRALVILLKNQTTDEQKANTTTHSNDIGFAGCDARTGSITAKYYIKHNTLLPWQVEMWMKDWRGAPRISKYWRQLNTAANVAAR